jgi:peptide/nickel transport system permease protein
MAGQVAGLLVCRLAFAVLVVLGVTGVTFVLTYVVPGDPARAILGVQADEATVTNLRQALGLNHPVYSQYLLFLGRILQGNLGRSYLTGEDVLGAIITRLPVTLKLALAVVCIAAGGGIVVGALAAWKPQNPVSRASIGLLTGMAAVPAFFLAVVASWIVAGKFGLAPISGYKPGFEGAKYLALPCVVLAIYPTALIARFVRSHLTEVMAQPYILTHRAIGMAEVRVLRYALKNVLLSTVTVVGNVTAAILTGTFFVESIFALPGLGLLAVHASIRYDFPMIQGIVLFIAVAYVGINALTDIVYLLVDPRVGRES